MPAPAAARASAPAETSERSPVDYVQLARTATEAGRFAAAIEFIDKGQTRLLDRSVAQNRTFDPIDDDLIKQLSTAKQALRDKNPARAAQFLQAALARLQ